MELDEIILCIPGPWENLQALGSEVTGLQSGFVLIRDQLVELSTKDLVEISFEEHDPRMAAAFQFAWDGLRPPEFLEYINSHRSVVYLHFPFHLDDQWQRIINFVNVLRAAGGYAIKMENSGISHDWARWESFRNGTGFELYHAATALVGDGPGYCFSCGMHLLDLPDAAVRSTVLPPDASQLIYRFNLFQLLEKPVLQSGHTFSLDKDAPRYRLSLEDAPYEQGEPFHNPHGCWTLSPME